MNKQISIIIPACNEEKYIEATVESIRGCGDKDYEIIVVANGCSDKTVDVLKKIKGVGFDVIDKANVSLARNVGVKKSKGDILFFLDADTHVSKDCLSIIRNSINDGITVGTFYVKPDNKKIFSRFIMLIKNIVLLSGLYKTSNGSIFCSRETFDNVGGFRITLHKHEDGVFVRTAAKFGKYKLFRNAYVVTSMRRYEKIGYFNTMFFWVKDFFKTILGIHDEKYSIIR